MDGSTRVPQQCEDCYYIDKVARQKLAIIRSQDANRCYKERIAQLEQQVRVRDRKIRSLEQQIHDWTYAVNCMPGFIRRLIAWRYSRRS